VPEADSGGGGAGLGRVRLEHGKAKGMTGGTPRSATVARRRRREAGRRRLGPEGQLGRDAEWAAAADCASGLLGCGTREEQAAATAEARLARGCGLKEEGNRVGRWEKL
jgi:hypothetical protein